MATIRKRGDRYQVQVRMQGHKPFSKSFRNKRDASKWGREQEVLIEKGGVFDTAGTTLSDAIDRFQEERTTYTYQDNVLKWWTDELGIRPLSTLRKADFIEARKRLQKLKNKHGDRVAPATVNRRMAAIAAVLTDCTDVNGH